MPWPMTRPGANQKQTLLKLSSTRKKANNTKQNYPGSVAFYDTRPGNEVVGLFYNARTSEVQVRVVHQKAPRYLTDYCIAVSSVDGQQHLCSAKHYQMIVPLPLHSLSSYGRRAFAVAGPTAWNSLSDDLNYPALSTDSFRRPLFSES